MDYAARFGKPGNSRRAKLFLARIRNKIRLLALMTVGVRRWAIAYHSIGAIGWVGVGTDYSNPCSRALVTASVRLRACSLPKIWCKCHLAVPMEIPSLSAIS